MGHKKRSSKNLQISQNIISSHRKSSVKIGIPKSFEKQPFKQLFRKKIKLTNLCKIRLICLKVAFLQTFVEGGVFRPQSDT